MNFGLITALWKGRELRHKEFWAKVGDVTTILLSIITAIAAMFPSMGVTPELLNSAAVAIANTGAILAGHEVLGPESYQWIAGFVGALFTFVWNKYFKTVTSADKGFGKLPTSGGAS